MNNYDSDTICDNDVETLTTRIIKHSNTNVGKYFLPAFRIKVIINSLKLLGKDISKNNNNGFSFHCCVSFNDDAQRKYFSRFPKDNIFNCASLEDAFAFDACAFEGLVSATDQMKLSFIYLQKNTFASDNELSVFDHQLNDSAEKWPGKYNSQNFSGDEINVVDWELTYSIYSERYLQD